MILVLQVFEERPGVCFKLKSNILVHCVLLWFMSLHFWHLKVLLARSYDFCFCESASFWKECHGFRIKLVMAPVFVMLKSLWLMGSTFFYICQTKFWQVSPLLSSVSFTCSRYLAACWHLRPLLPYSAWCTWWLCWVAVSVENGSWTHPMPLAGVQCTEVDVRMICFRQFGLSYCVLCLVPCYLALEGTHLLVSKVQMCSIWRKKKKRNHALKHMES